jgi:hypothetical protein
VILVYLHVVKPLQEFQNIFIIRQETSYLVAVPPIPFLPSPYQTTNLLIISGFDYSGHVMNKESHNTQLLSGFLP